MDVTVLGMKSYKENETVDASPTSEYAIEQFKDPRSFRKRSHPSMLKRFSFIPKKILGGDMATSLDIWRVV